MALNNADKQYEQLMDVFRKTNADGTYYYTDGEVRHWLPMLFITSGIPAAQWTPDMVTVFNEFLAKAEIKEDDANAYAKVVRFYRHHPVNAELEQDLRGMLTRLKLDNQDDLKRKVEATLGSMQGKAKDAGLAAPMRNGTSLKRKR